MHLFFRENRLRWFEHVYCKPVDVVVKRVDRVVLGSNGTGRRRPRLTLDVVRKDTSLLSLSEQVAMDRSQWGGKK